MTRKSAAPETPAPLPATLPATGGCYVLEGGQLKRADEAASTGVERPVQAPEQEA